jgi:hypothetical protein
MKSSLSLAINCPNCNYLFYFKAREKQARRKAQSKGQKRRRSPGVQGRRRVQALSFKQVVVNAEPQEKTAPEHRAPSHLE